MCVRGRDYELRFRECAFRAVNAHTAQAHARERLLF